MPALLKMKSRRPVLAGDALDQTLHAREVRDVEGGGRRGASRRSTRSGDRGRLVDLHDR